MSETVPATIMGMRMSTASKEQLETASTGICPLCKPAEGQPKQMKYLGDVDGHRMWYCTPCHVQWLAPLPADSNPINWLDADGLPILPGNVMYRADDLTKRGVVTRVVRRAEECHGFMGVGDMMLAETHHQGCSTVSSAHNKWRRVPREEWVPMECYMHWRHTPFCENGSERPAIEQMATQGITALLPSDVIDWEYGPSPDLLEDALHYMARYLETLHPRNVLLSSLPPKKDEAVRQLQTLLEILEKDLPWTIKRRSGERTLFARSKDMPQFDSTQVMVAYRAGYTVEIDKRS